LRENGGCQRTEKKQPYRRKQTWATPRAVGFTKVKRAKKGGSNRLTGSKEKGGARSRGAILRKIGKLTQAIRRKNGTQTKVWGKKKKTKARRKKIHVDGERQGGGDGKKKSVYKQTGVPCGPAQLNDSRLRKK